MDDSEARYLIDQFNKYASWIMKGPELVIPILALIVASMALVISVMNPLGLFSRYPPPWNSVALAVFASPILALWLLWSRIFNKIIDEYGQNRRRLIALMDHYSKYRSLPDSLTFGTIVKWKPEELEKALADSQPHRSQAS